MILTTQQLLGVLSLSVAIFALSVALPFVTSFLIDGFSYLRRKGSVVPLVIVVVATVLLAGAGALLLLAGLALTAVGEGGADALVRTVRGGSVLLLSFAVPLAVLTAGIRRMVRRAHREDIRRAEASVLEEQERLEQAVGAIEERVFAGYVTDIRSRRRAVG